MQWTDEGLILSVRSHGETAAIVEILTRQHGRWLGLVYGGRSRKARPVLQTGTHVDATWKGRLAENLGMFTVELRRSYGSEAMDDGAALCALTSVCTLVRQLPERDPHPNLFEISLFLLGFLDDPTVWPALYVRWELALLNELGVGLDLTQCAVTGRTDDLIYVSPKSGRAVSTAAGEAFKDRLLALPPFLRGQAGAGVGPDDVIAGLRLTGYFLASRVFGTKGEDIPEPRIRLEGIIARLNAPS